MLSLVAREFKHGMHCDRGETWWEGPKLFSAGWLIHRHVRKLLNVELFDDFRRTGKTRYPFIKKHSAWHLSSFGNASDLKRKLTTFGAAYLFKPTYKGMLDEARLTACIAGCIQLLTDDNRPTPCLSTTVDGQRTNAKYRNPRDGPTRAGGRLHLPPYLIDHLDEFPSSWAAFLDLTPTTTSSSESFTAAQRVKSKYLTTSEEVLDGH